jgi:polar amino acid transport system substrate-binding protein
MRAILEDMKTGRVESCDIPAPELHPGGILVLTHFSAISAGTERVKVETGEKSLLQKAMARPDLVMQVIEHARQNGVRSAIHKVQARLDTLTPLGYSCAGTVLQVGEGVTEFRPGDRVACAGANYATHSEINFVPRNLAVPVPSSVPLNAASLATIGAIAMQGLRQSQIAFGESVAVIGAGLVGVITIQIARAAGCRVIAIDRDRKRTETALSLGAHYAVCTEDRELAQRVQGFSRYGVDAAVITAATPSAEPVELAASILRDRGRIVVVGDVGMGVSRNNMYIKELSLLMSRSYGPGRYDIQYEEAGRDYPIGYVRWTEQRNMEAFLDLLATRAIDLSPLLEHTYAVEEGERAYDDIRHKGAYTVIISYGVACDTVGPTLAVVAPRQRVIGEIRVGMIGAGAFARSVLVPNIRSCPGVSLEAVSSLSSVGAESARRVCGFRQATTSAGLLGSIDVDAVFIASHHDSHAGYVAQALANQKMVFAEKPLATTIEQLDSVRSAYRAANSPFLMVGFNRRFAPATEKIREYFAGRGEPMIVHVRVNAGFIPRDHWVHADGGRIVGELCHFVDWARAVVAVPICSVFACGLPDGTRYHQDNLAVTLGFADGSIANLLYLANGDRSVPKEYCEVFSEGKAARLDDWSTIRLAAGGKEKKITLSHNKGHKREIELTIAAMREGKPSPIDFCELIEVTEVTFAVQKSLVNGQVIKF